MSCSTLKDFEETFSKLEKNVSEDLQTLVDEVHPIEDFTKRAVIGAFEGTADPRTLDNLDTLSAKLSSLVEEYLNEALANLNTATPAENLVQGVKDNLFNDDTKAKLNDLIKSVLASASGEVQTAVNDIFTTLDSPRNKEILSGLFESLLSENNSKKLNRDFLNSAITNLDFKTLEQKLINELLTDDLSARIDSITASAVRAASSEAQEPLSWIQKWVKGLIGLVVAAAAGIIWLVYHFRRKNLRNISNILMAEIQDMGDEGSYRDLTQKIKQVAIANNLEPELRKILEKNGLLHSGKSGLEKKKWE